MAIAQKHVKKGGQIFLPIHKEKQINETINVSYERFTEQENSFILSNPYYFHEEENNESKGAYISQKDDMFVEDEHCGPSIERDLFGYNLKEFSYPLYDELAERNEENSSYTLLDLEENVNIQEEEESTSETTYEYEEVWDESSHKDVPEVSFLSSLLEEDLLCNQIYQHYHEDNIPNDFEVGITHDMYLEGETSPSLSYGQEMKSYEHSSEYLPSFISDQILGKRKVASFEDELFSKPFCGNNQHLECGDREDCIQEDNQAKNICLDTFMTDQMHDVGDLAFNEWYSALEDLSKAKQESDAKDCIHEAEIVSIAHEDDTFDTGKKYEQHTKVSLLKDSVIIFVNNMLKEVLLSFHCISLEDFSSICTDQINKAIDQVFGLNDNQIYLFSDDLIDKAKVNSNPKWVMKEKHMSCDDYFLTK